MVDKTPEGLPLRETVMLSLSNAMGNHYAVHDWEPRALAVELLNCDASLEMLAEADVLPHILEWKAINAAIRNALDSFVASGREPGKLGLQKVTQSIFDMHLFGATQFEVFEGIVKFWMDEHGYPL